MQTQSTLFYNETICFTVSPREPVPIIAILKFIQSKGTRYTCHGNLKFNQSKGTTAVLGKVLNYCEIKPIKIHFCCVHRRVTGNSKQHFITNQ